MKTTERWYTTEDEDAPAVKEGDPRARRLLVGAGGEIDDAIARKYGILEPSKASYEAKAVEPEEKAIEAAPENKALDMPPAVKRTRKVKASK